MNGFEKRIIGDANVSEIDPWRDRQRIKWRSTIFLRKDEAIFSEALRKEFPGVRFFTPIVERGKCVAWPEVSSLAESNDCAVDLVFPEYMGPMEIEEGLASDRDWLQEGRRPHHRCMSYRGSSWEWEEKTSNYYRNRLSYDPPTPYEGSIQAAYFPDFLQHRMHLEIIKRVWKVMSRVATNRFKGGHPLGNQLMDGDAVLMKQVRHPSLWIGHWALQWCRDGLAAGERRMLRALYRPCDDWEMPRTSEYRSLCQFVERKYGQDFGGPPTEPKHWRDESLTGAASNNGN